MNDKFNDLLRRIEDIISNIDIEPIRKLFEKLNLDRVFAKTFSKKFLAIAFSLVVALISIVSLITVISERNDASEITTTAVQSSEDTMQAVTAISPAQDFRGNFLLLLDDDSSEDIHMIALVRLDSYENSMRISFVNKNATCTVNDFSGTLTQHYKKGGIKQLVWAVGDYTNISIERYLVGDEDAFERFVKSLGSMDVNIPEKVSHDHHGIGYIIEKGTQALTPPMFLKYFLYLCSQDKGESVAELLVLMGINVFSEADDEKFQDNMEAFTKTFDTNISAVDFGTYKGALKKLASPDNTLLLSVETDFEKFRQ